MRKMLLTITLSIFVLIAFPIVTLATETITFTIHCEVTAVFDETLKACKHFYSVDQGGKEIIPPTRFMDNTATVIKLPKTNEIYKINFYFQDTWDFGEVPMNKKPILDQEFKGIASQEVKFRDTDPGVHDLILITPPVSDIVISNNASSTSGESPISVPATVIFIVLGIAGAFAAMGLSGEGEDNSNSDKETKAKSNYKMCIYKDFCDKIKYNGETVYIYARMVEINSEGIEIPRPDLTQKISIFSHNEFLNISPAIFQGDYMGSSVEAFAENPAIMPEEAVISFKYIGEGGTFQNNVKFQMVGDCYIEVEGGKVFALADSGQSFEHPYKLIDFLNNVEDVIINNIDGNSEFDLSLGKDKNGNTIIIVSDHSQKRNTESFYCNYKCEIIAKNEKEFARTTFNVVLCYEGILPDFLGKKKEIAAYMNDQDEMLETIVAVRLGTWDETKKNLNIRRPDSAEVSFSDDENIFEVVGLEIILDEERSTSDYSLYVFRAEKSLPASESIKGKLLLIYPSETCSFESETDVEMIPDLLEYEKEREKEYQNCIRIIDTYLPINFRAKKHHELDASKDIMGIKDFQLFRKKCWEIASRCILQEKESYLIESYWYDEAIATAELVVFIGDSALDVALAPFGGPITGFVISQVKSSFIELVSMRIEKGTIGYSEIFDLIKNRLQQMAGQADGLIETPGYNKPKVLVAWLTSYILYRIMYHWYYDMDQETNEPKGLFEAVQSGLVDFAGKGISILLGEYAKDIADTRGISADTALEQEWVNKQVEKGAKKGLDAMGKMAESLDKKISEICAVIMDYIDKIRSGKV